MLVLYNQCARAHRPRVRKRNALNRTVRVCVHEITQHSTLLTAPCRARPIVCPLRETFITRCFVQRAITGQIWYGFYKRVDPEWTVVCTRTQRRSVVKCSRQKVRACLLAYNLSRYVCFYDLCYSHRPGSVYYRLCSRHSTE